jgi:hypothetical protein
MKPTTKERAARPPNVRPPPAVVAARRRDIARRYRRARQGKAQQPRTFAAVRISELNRLYVHRYGGVLPDDNNGALCAKIALHHMAHLREAGRRMASWLAAFAPWFDLGDREILIDEALEHSLRWRADRLAWKLRVTAAERERLGLRTIGAIDMTAEQRRELARERKAERRRERRRAAGMRERAEYEAQSLAREQPWTTLGISRRTWYRRRRNGGMAQA